MVARHLKITRRLVSVCEHYCAMLSIANGIVYVGNNDGDVIIMHVKCCCMMVINYEPVNSIYI